MQKTVCACFHLVCPADCLPCRGPSALHIKKGQFGAVLPVRIIKQLMMSQRAILTLLARC